MELLNIGDTCPNCEYGKLFLKTKELQYVYKTRLSKITKTVWACTECEVIFLQKKDEKEVDEFLIKERLIENQSNP